MNKFKRFLAVASMAMALVFSTGCTRITDGEVGVRTDTYGAIDSKELTTGYHQTLFGSIKEFPIRDISMSVENHRPTTSENSPMGDFDATLIYSINAGSVAELYKSKSKNYHSEDTDGSVRLMYNYLWGTVGNAIQKTVRKYKQLEVADNREKMEVEIAQTIREQLAKDGLDKDIHINTVRVTSAQPNPVILEAATNLVKSENELKIANNRVALAKSEAERQDALAKNGPATIAYMNAQSQMMIAEAVRNGKVQTILIPHNITAIGKLN